MRIKEAVSFELSTRYVYNEDCIQQLLNVITYLDPQYKKLLFNDSEKRKVLQEIDLMLMSHVSLVEAILRIALN